MSFGRDRQRKPLPTINLPTARSAPGLDLTRQIVLVFGERGTGKSTLLNTEAPDSTLFISTHAGLGAISCMAVDVVSLDELRATILALRSPDAAHITHVVIDEIDDVYKWMLDDVLAERGFRSMAQVGEDSAGVYADASAKFDSTMQLLRKLPQSVRLTSGQRLNEPRGKSKGKIPTTISCGLSGSPRRILAKHIDHMWRLRHSGKGNGRTLDLVGFEEDGAMLECKARLPDSAKGTLPRSIPMTAGTEPLGWSHVVSTFDAAMRGPEAL